MCVCVFFLLLYDLWLLSVDKGLKMFYKAWSMIFFLFAENGGSFFFFSLKSTCVWMR